MNAKTKALLAVGFLLPATSMAGKEVGNGGDAVVCREPDGAIRSVELLDFYEARTLRGMEIDLAGKELSVPEKVERALVRIRDLGPLRYERYRELAGRFESEMRLIPGISLVDVPDSQEVVVPKSCAIEQVAIQAKPKFAEDPYYVISKNLWDKMDADNRAGLVLHEIIYRAALAQPEPHQSSIFVRYFNSYLSSRKPEASHVGEYFKVLWQAQLQGEERIQGVTVPAEHIPRPEAFNSAGIVGALHGTEIQFRGKTIPLAAPEVQFYTNGGLYSFQPSVKLREKVGAQELELVEGGVVEYYENGSLRSGTTMGFTGEGPGYRVQKSTRFAVKTTVSFWPETALLQSIKFHYYDAVPAYLFWVDDAVQVLFRGEWFKAMGRQFSFNEKGQAHRPMLESLRPEQVNLGKNSFPDSYARFCPAEKDYQICGVRFSKHVMKAVIQEKEVLVSGGEYGILTYPNGSIRFCVLAEGATLHSPNGSRYFKEGTAIYFDPFELAPPKEN